MFATKVLNGPATDRVQVIRNAHICDALRTTKSTLLALMLLAPATLVVADDHAPWQGKWISATAEDIGSGFANRSFDLGENDWTLAFTLYADEAQSQAVFRIEFAGRYLVGGPSAYVADAQEAVFQYASRSVTPLSEGAVAMFAAAGCTTRLAQPMDATLTGCGFVPSVIASAVEYDLISITGVEMRLGDRSGDLARERPAKLSDFPLIRQD